VHRLLSPALALLLLAAPWSGRAAVQARLVPEVTAGAGWASDLFPGADFGAHGQTLLVPGVGADLSTGPVVKFLSRYRYSLSRYFRQDGEDAGLRGHDAELTTRVRLGRGFDFDLLATYGSVELDDTVLVDQDLPEGVALRWFETGPLLRFRPDRASRLEAGGIFRSSALRFEEAGDGWHGERAWTAFAGGSRRFGARVETALRLQHEAVTSFGGYDRVGDGAVAAVAVVPWRELVARASVGVDHVRYSAYPVAGASRRREDLRRTYGLSTSHPLGEYLDLEASAAWTITTSNLPFVEGDRISCWLGVRGQLPHWL
jgi:hypothetical protein